MKNLYYYYWRSVVPLMIRMTACAPSGQAKSVWIDVGARQSFDQKENLLFRRHD